MALIYLVRGVVRWVIGKPWLLIVVGVALLILAPTYDGKRPPCGDDDMRPGQVCEYDDGTVTTYEQEAGDDRLNFWVLGGLGLISVGAGIYGLVRKRLASKEIDAASPGEAQFPTPPKVPPGAGPARPLDGAAPSPSPTGPRNSPFDLPPDAPLPGHGTPLPPTPEIDPPPRA